MTFGKKNGVPRFKGEVQLVILIFNQVSAVVAHKREGGGNANSIYEKPGEEVVAIVCHLAIAVQSAAADDNRACRRMSCAFCPCNAAGVTQASLICQLLIQPDIELRLSRAQVFIDGI